MFKAVSTRNPVTDIATLAGVSDIPDWLVHKERYICRNYFVVRSPGQSAPGWKETSLSLVSLLRSLSWTNFQDWVEDVKAHSYHEDLGKKKVYSLRTKVLSCRRFTNSFWPNDCDIWERASVGVSSKCVQYQNLFLYVHRFWKQIKHLELSLNLS